MMVITIFGIVMLMRIGKEGTTIILFTQGIITECNQKRVEEVWYCTCTVLRIIPAFVLFLNANYFSAVPARKSPLKCLQTDTNLRK